MAWLPSARLIGFTITQLTNEWLFSCDSQNGSKFFFYIFSQIGKPMPPSPTRDRKNSMGSPLRVQNSPKRRSSRIEKRYDSSAVNLYFCLMTCCRCCIGLMFIFIFFATVPRPRSHRRIHHLLTWAVTRSEYKKQFPSRLWRFKNHKHALVTADHRLTLGLFFLHTGLFLTSSDEWVTSSYSSMNNELILNLLHPWLSKQQLSRIYFQNTKVQSAVFPPKAGKKKIVQNISKPLFGVMIN